MISARLNYPVVALNYMKMHFQIWIELNKNDLNDQIHTKIYKNEQLG